MQYYKKQDYQDRIVEVRNLRRQNFGRQYSALVLTCARSSRQALTQQPSNIFSSGWHWSRLVAWKSPQLSGIGTVKTAANARTNNDITLNKNNSCRPYR